MGGLRTFATQQLARFTMWVGGTMLFPGAKGRGKEVPGGLTADQKDLLSQVEHRTLLNASRAVYNSFPVLSGAIDDKANAVVGNGWGPQFDGVDLEWGEPAETWLYHHFKVIDVRGRPYDMHQDTHIGSVVLDRDGEYFIHLFKNDAGYPQIQVLESHRIGDRNTQTRYEGAQVRNGIAYNSYGRPIAYHFLGETKALDRWIPARHIHHVFDPKWFSQGRGISPIIFGILDWLDVAEVRNNEKVAQRIFSSLALKHKSKAGKPRGFPEHFGKAGKTEVSEDGQSSQKIVEDFFAGQTRHMLLGEDVESLIADRPTVNQRAFEESVLRGAFAAIGWTYEQSVDASKLGGNTSRRDLTKNQRSVERRQQVLFYPWNRVAGYSVAVAMQLGLIPSNPEWYAWVPQLPAKMTADAGNEAKIEQEEYKLGGLTMKRFCGRRGEWWRDVRQQKETETDDLLDRAKRLADKHGVPLLVALNLLEQRTPNGAQVTNESDEPTDQNSKEKETNAA